MRSLRNVLSRIRLVFLDVDGVLTDGSIILLPDGDEQKIFDVKDGTGIVWAHWVGIEVALITGRKSKILERRARELRIRHVAQKITDKVAAAETILRRCGIGFDQTAAMGDDFGDLGLLERVALPTCPADAHQDVAKACRWRSSKPGGHGAVRDLLERIIRAQGLMPEVLRRYGLERHQERRGNR